MKEKLEKINGMMYASSCKSYGYDGCYLLFK